MELVRKTIPLPPSPALALYLAAAGVLAFGYCFDQSTCLWRAVTGLPCPGCGMVHAMLALARGDVRAAWGFNPGSFVAAPVLLSTGIRTIKELVA